MGPGTIQDRQADMSQLIKHLTRRACMLLYCSLNPYKKLSYTCNGLLSDVVNWVNPSNIESKLNKK